MRRFISLCSGLVFLSLSCIAGEGVMLDTNDQERNYRSRDVVVTATRAPIERSSSPAMVSIISEQFLRQLGMPSLGTALCYVPGVRTEVNCQTCNYSQVRLNGLAGAYTQILINGRPIVSPLVSLYGLEQFPTAMLERIEVLRGSASVLYGSSAIAGVINLVTRDRWDQGGVITSSLNLVGGRTPETVTSATLMLPSGTAGAFALTVHHRARGGYDANGDGYTELARLRNTGIGADAVFDWGNSTFRTSVAFINEERRGGNLLDEPPDRADQAEYRNHDMVFFTASYTAPLGEQQCELYAAANTTRRVHYTGVDHADGWGRTGSTYGIVGGQVRIPELLNTTVGAEYQFEQTTDVIQAYGYAIDQDIGQGGVFTQLNAELIPRLSLLAGIRLAWHSAMRGMVFLSRGALLWRPKETWEFRLNYGEGFRAPQAFEADMHIAFASGGISFIRLDPRLQREMAQSLSLSVTHRIQTGAFFAEFNLDGFATRLRNPFVLADDGFDSMGNRILLRTNGTAARVVGVSGEGQCQWKAVELLVTLTVQRSVYDEPVEWSQQLAPERRFLRTPDLYGSATLRLPIGHQWEVLTTAILTGPMLVPHMPLDGDRLVQTPLMGDVSITARYDLGQVLPSVGKMALGIRVNNLFNAYQRDFDRGRYRDSNYIWGPPQPRTVGMEFQWSF